MKILVVDDDRVLADLVAFALRRENFTAILAHDGEAALFRDDMLAFWRRVLRGQPDR